MGMTQQGHCFVVLFYLFLDNEKSAEGLAWCLLPHIYTHETPPSPYGLSTGGYLTLLILKHQRHSFWSLFFRGLIWICTATLPPPMGWHCYYPTQHCNIPAASSLHSASSLCKRFPRWLTGGLMVYEHLYVKASFWQHVDYEKWWWPRGQAVRFKLSPLSFFLLGHFVHACESGL